VVEAAVGSSESVVADSVGRSGAVDEDGVVEVDEVVDAVDARSLSLVASVAEVGASALSCGQAGRARALVMARRGATSRGVIGQSSKQ